MRDLFDQSPHITVHYSLGGVHAAVPAQIRLIEEATEDGFLYRDKTPPGHIVDATYRPSGTARLEWRLELRNGKEWVEGRNVKGCLWRFVRLADASAHEIFDFAQNYGVLGICQEHLWPGVHAGCRPHIVRYAATIPRPDASAYSDAWYWEDLRQWRKLALRVQALLRIIHKLQVSRVVEWQDWQDAWDVRVWDIFWGGYEGMSMDRPFVGADPPQPGRLLEWIAGKEHQLLVAHINLLIRMANLTPCFNIANNARKLGEELTLGNLSERSIFSPWPSNSLFRVLVLQLITTLTTYKYTIPCAVCGSLMEVARRPRTDRNSYCSDECRKLGKLVANRKSTARRGHRREMGI